MAIRITYFVHGTTTDNEQHVSSGWKDVELSELGVKQSVDLKDQTKDLKFDVVFCSDLQRAHNSAKLAWDGIYEIIPDARLRECNYGDLNGASSDVVEPMQGRGRVFFQHVDRHDRHDAFRQLCRPRDFPGATLGRNGRRR